MATAQRRMAPSTWSSTVSSWRPNVILWVVTVAPLSSVATRDALARAEPPWPARSGGLGPPARCRPGGLQLAAGARSDVEGPVAPRGPRRGGSAFFRGASGGPAPARWSGVARARRRAALRSALHHARVRAWEARSGLAARCRFLWGRAYLHADGRVSPCCVQGRPWVGSLHESSFHSIWTGPAMTALRAGMYDGQPHAACARCAQGEGPSPPPREAWTAPGGATA